MENSPSVFGTTVRGAWSPARLGRVGGCALLLSVASVALHAEPVEVPIRNGSFEAPETVFADPRIDAWQKAPKPAWYDESGGFPWDQLAGVFLNTAPGASDHIVNVVGKQAAFLFAVPEVALSQDVASGEPGGSGLTFEVGRSYQMAAGVFGGSGGMKPGVTLQLAFYYRDAAGAPVVVSSTTVTNAGPSVAPFRFVEAQVNVPAVKAGDAWAGRALGIRIASTVSPDLSGGYWDIENVRLTRDVPVPNGSFELPSVTFADPRVDSWQKSSKPDWYDESGGFPWSQLSGVFLNTAPGASDHLENMAGSQAAFFFAVPQVELFQDANSPGRELDVRFQPGRMYRLDVAVAGGGGGMKPGVALRLELYARDDAGGVLTVGATTVTHSPELFPTVTRFHEFQVRTPVVKPGDPWANRNLGIRLLSAVTPELAGGYWDIDNVRLTEETGTTLEGMQKRDGTFSFVVRSAPGLVLEVESATALAASADAWRSVGTLTNVTGNVTFTDPAAGEGARFYRVKQSP